jgi:cob(I)alamin adenosyltransferase
MLKEKCKELQKKIDMLGLELAGMKDANDRNSIDKLKEIDRLKATIDDLTRMVESLKNNSSDQIKDMERV